MQTSRRTLLGAIGVSAMLRGTPLFAATAEPKPPRIPAETFAERPAMEGLQLSPDGNKVLARMQVRGQEMLGTYVIATGALKGYTLPKGSELRWYRWAGSDRFLVSVIMKFNQREEFGISTMLIEGMATRLLSFDLASEAGTFIGFTDSTNVGDDVLYVDPAGEYLLLSVSRSYGQAPGIYRCALKDNHPDLAVRPMDGVHDWYADDKGVVRAGIGFDRGNWFLAYRSGPDVEFHKVARGETHLFEDAPTGVMHFSGGTDQGYIISNRDGGLNAVYKYDFAARTIGDKVFGCPTNDVQDLQFDPNSHALIGVGYTDDRDRIAWLDPLMKEVQDGIDRALAGRQNRILSWSDDKAVLLVHSGTTRDLGTYYVFQISNTKLSPLVRPSPKLVPAELAPMEAVKYKARDGLEIPAYLTLPIGRDPKGLPLVIMPHGGPYGVRDTLEFNPEVQLLANRGYVVLQPNYRGSDSYGIDYYKRGYGEWGRKMQDDLDDGMDWLVGRSIVDPKRACLVGGSYGGYAAAWGATRNPERYRCASCFAGVFNLRKQLSYTGDFLSSRIYREFKSTVRGPGSFDLDAVSPLFSAARLQVPVLLIHGDDDHTVPIEQSKDYDAALTQARKPHEYYVIKDEGHGFYRQKDSFAFYLGKLETFLARYNPADQA
ncbi:MAG TPA: prolyl oligopeptidase family serine peptidase [Allosphingosinicella sp.]|jgi:dienelactone hydrolase